MTPLEPTAVYTVIGLLLAGGVTLMAWPQISRFFAVSSVPEAEEDLDLNQITSDRLFRAAARFEALGDDTSAQTCRDLIGQLWSHAGSPNKTQQSSAT